MDAALASKLQKVLKLTQSPVEGEAAAAAAVLARILADHNLSIANLEAKGEVARPAVGETKVDLGKSAWRWKLALAKVLADHYFCVALAAERAKNPVFVGRPDNVEALKMLYSWLIDQINGIARTERRIFAEKTGDHIDPLRWNLNFGEGAVSRLAERLVERRKAEESKAGTALVVSLASENSDYLEEKYGFRTDGGKAKHEREEEKRREANLARWQAEDKAREALRAKCEATGDMEPYYRECPWARPEETRAESAEQIAKRTARLAREAAASVRRMRAERERRNRAAEREAEKAWRAAQDPAKRERKRQALAAEDAGFVAAERVNLEPFIEGPGGEDEPQALPGG